MTKDYELFKDLMEAANYAGVAFTLTYEEAAGNYEFRIISAAESECGYLKRAYSLQNCLDLLKEKTKQP